MEIALAGRANFRSIVCKPVRQPGLERNPEVGRITIGLQEFLIELNPALN
jgi:hypothetical protein